MPDLSSSVMRHLHEIERQLDALERRIRALEDLRAMRRNPSRVVPSPAPVGVLQEV